jgi:hypothetical protein
VAVAFHRSDKQLLSFYAPFVMWVGRGPARAAVTLVAALEAHIATLKTELAGEKERADRAIAPAALPCST